MALLLLLLCTSFSSLSALAYIALLEQNVGKYPGLPTICMLAENGPSVHTEGKFLDLLADTDLRRSDLLYRGTFPSKIVWRRVPPLRPTSIQSKKFSVSF
jgi:hypothetical protein